MVKKGMVRPFELLQSEGKDGLYVEKADWYRVIITCSSVSPTVSCAMPNSPCITAPSPMPKWDWLCSSPSLRTNLDHRLGILKEMTYSTTGLAWVPSRDLHLKFRLESGEERSVQSVVLAWGLCRWRVRRYPGRMSMHEALPTPKVFGTVHITLRHRLWFSEVLICTSYHVYYQYACINKVGRSIQTACQISRSNIIYVINPNRVPSRVV